MHLKMLLRAVFCAAFCNSAFGAFIISLDSITTTSMTISVDGVLGPLPAGDITGGQIFYCGVPGDADWINSDSATFGFVSTGFNTQSPVDGGLVDSEIGDAVGFLMPGVIAEGDEYHFTVTLTESDFSPANVDPQDFIITLGYASLDTLPDPSMQLGSAIPEPSTYAALSGLSVLGLAALRRKKHSER